MAQTTQRVDKYDTSLSFLYKKAILEYRVPIRLLVVIRTYNNKIPTSPTQIESTENTEADLLDLEEENKVAYMTIFSLIKYIALGNGPDSGIAEIGPASLSVIWDTINTFHGDKINPLEVIPIFVHTFPDLFITENKDVLEMIINFINKINEVARFTTIANVYEYYKNIWLPAYKQEFNVDTEILNNIIKSQEVISKLPIANHGVIEVSSVTYSYRYLFHPDINPLGDMFSTSVTDYVVPYIQYNLEASRKETPSSIQRYYRIYKGESRETRPNYSNIIMSTSETVRPYTIYLKMWNGSGNILSYQVRGMIRKAPKENFLLVTLQYLNNILTVTFTLDKNRSVSMEEILERIHIHIPFLPSPDRCITNDIIKECPAAIEEVRVSGYFYIYGISLDDIALVDIIMLDDLFSTYLFIDETTKVYAYKKRLKINYKGFIFKPNKKKEEGSLSALLHAEELKAETIVKYVQGNQVKQGKLETDTTAIKVTITKAASRRIVNQFIEIMAKLIRQYSKLKKKVIDEYMILAPEYFETRGISEVPKQITPAITGKSKAKRLFNAAPDIFIKNYPRTVCGKEFQPEVITEEQIEYWRNKPVNFNGKTYPRDIIRFPKDNPQVILVCDNDRNPFMILRPNVLDNKNKYPYLPCCRQTPQDSNSIIYKYYHNISIAVTNTKSPGRPVSTRKFLTQGGLGELNEVITGVLAGYTNQSTKFYRYGVVPASNRYLESPNSFIHAVLTAVNFGPYLESNDREAYTISFRERLFEPNLVDGKQLLPDIMKQENYDTAIDDIIDNASGDGFFDPLLYYRGMEYLFDCVIYIFSLTDIDENTGYKRSYLQVPRNLFFHARPFVYSDKVILVTRHWGPKDVNALIPQCELIVDNPNKGTLIALFGPSMNDILYPIFRFGIRTLTWQLSEDISEVEPQLSLRLDIYSAINYTYLFGKIPITGQYIDSAGKVRILEVAPQWANKEHTELSSLRIYVNILPTQPENVPQISLEYIAGNLPHYTRIIEMFGDPKGISLTHDNSIIMGLWFNLGDIEYGIYCPIQDVPFGEIYPNIPIVPEYIFTSIAISIPRNEISPINRVLSLKRSSQYLHQILKYLYLLYVHETNDKNVENFVISIGILFEPNEEIDTADLYMLTSLPRILPLGSVSEVINKLSDYNNNIFIQGRILIYNISMYQGIIYLLTRFKNSIDGLNIQPSSLRELKDYYLTTCDFRVNNRTDFLLSTINEYNEWLKIYNPTDTISNVAAQSLNRGIQTSLEYISFTYQKPYLYQQGFDNLVSSSYDVKLDKFYLIQNVVSGNLKRAINVAATWANQKKNTGYYTDEYNGPNLMHVIYIISPGGGTILFQNNTGYDVITKEVNYLEILNYNNGMYAAMLPLL